MTIRERILSAARGGMPDWIPWTTYAGVCADTKTRQALQTKGLGLVSSLGTCVEETPNVETTSEKVTEGGIEFTLNTVRTPAGTLTQRTRVDPGYGSTWTLEHLVKDTGDYEILDFILRDAVYRPDYEGFIGPEAAMGDAGVVFTGVHRLPIQRLWIQYTGLERLSRDLRDSPAQVERVLETMLERDREMWALVADSPAEIVWCPDNISGEITGPPWFEKYCAPYYDELARVMHPKGKRLAAHMDGMMRRLLPQVRELDVDIIEAFTPPPDGDLSLKEARAAWEGKVIWINFPSSVHILSADQIRERTLEMLAEVVPGDRFLVGVTENIPDFAQATTLTTITETLNEFGKCPLEG